MSRGPALVVVTLGWWALYDAGRRLGLVVPFLALASLVALGVAFQKGALPRGPRPVRDLALGVVVGLVTAGATQLLHAALAPRWPAFASDVETLYAVLAPDGALGALVVVIALGEEALWRGLVFSAWRDRPLPLALALGTGSYAVGQLGALSVTVFLAAAGLGAIWALLRARTEGVVAPMVAHAVWTPTTVLLFPLA